jgi:hypothetical protein
MDAQPSVKYTDLINSLNPNLESAKNDSVSPQTNDFAKLTLNRRKK